MCLSSDVSVVKPRQVTLLLLSDHIQPFSHTLPLALSSSKEGVVLPRNLLRNLPLPPDSPLPRPLALVDNPV